MNEQATWLPHSEKVDILMSKSMSSYGPMVRIRRVDGRTLEVPRSELLMSTDAELILQLQLILMANNPARNPAYFSTVRNLLKRGAPLHLITQKKVLEGQQLQIF
ncbi:hypothetical protein [Paenibacillus agricola]|uniref:Uncharacterized protein n=1 Tax=Paenibacillus agricola TaxID=2716264 RepID=A0ABX0JHQ5_9BACL|nr:hypothetical protein [Paenibacillus agricola]NHN33255.1 hypothetical protein [Paenibacillus agricola]